MSAFNPLDHPICFAYALRLKSSGWIGHVPFAMYLMDILRPKVVVELGTHNGISYCSFCQAVKELKMETRCYAVDTWQGDDQAGFYGPEVLADLKEHHDPLYGGFSRLIQSTFDDAAVHFENKTIDLLHIDGYHTYEVVKHDFETWLPKMSARGVALFHDINVREGKFGVWKFWKTLRRQYPYFEFVHSHGLGLIAVGKQSPELLRELLTPSKEDQAQIREVFYQLGTRLEVSEELLALKRTAQEQSHASIGLQETIEAGRQQLSAYEIQLRQVADELARKNDELSKMHGKLSIYVAQASEQTEELSTARAQLSAYETQLGQVADELVRKNDELSRMDGRLSTCVAQASERTEELSRARAQLLVHEEQHNQRSIELAGKTAELSEIREHLSLAEGRLHEQAGALLKKNEELSQTVGQLTALQNQVMESQSEVRRYRSQLGEQTGEISAANARISEMEGRLNHQTEEIRRLRAQSLAGQNKLSHIANALAEEHARLHSKKEILAWMSTSRSWQLTAPLRRWSLSKQHRRAKSTQLLRGGFRGFIDSPEEGAGSTGSLKVIGWASSSEAPISLVEVFLDNIRLGTPRYGEERPDVASVFSPQVPIACGFSEVFLLDEYFVGPRLLMVRVTDERGNIQDFFRNVTILKPADESLVSGSIAAGLKGIADEEALGEEDRLLVSKKTLASMAQISLDSFLASNSTITIPSQQAPEISIILVLYNRAALSLQCLYSIMRSDFDSFEVIIVDNASTDETRRLLKRIRGAQIIQNETNLHFLRACNQASKTTRGKSILFLNNDAQLVAGSISAALRTLNSSNEIGAVGGKIILPDGTLQEAGSLIWQDGSCLGYGRGDSPVAPPYMFKRDVDFCSGAFLLTTRELFLEDAGFDEDYAPAYYEEVDYCVRLWKKGKRVVYDPNAIIFHFEFASSKSQQGAINLQLEHQKMFREKNADWLQLQQVPDVENILAARVHERNGERRILFFDDRVPHLTLGSGFPRSNRILWELVQLGHLVTFYPTNFPQEDWLDAYQDIPSEVEVMVDHGWEKLAGFLSKRSNFYDVIFISRPHNMALFKSILAENPGICGKARIVYDAEALFSYREIEQSRVGGKELSKDEQMQLIRKEVALAENCDYIVSVSDREGHEFSRYGFERVFTLGHSVEIAPTENDFDLRKDILFVGAIHSVTSPNADAMIWFSENILPLVQEGLREDIKLMIAGPSCSEFRERLTNGSVHLVGKIDDLAPLYNRARLFIAPTRYSAGIPLKVCEAAAYGLPTVATSLTGLQLGWNDEEELLLADDPQTFADACVRLYGDRSLWNQLRENMIKRVSQDFSSEKFSERLKLIIR